MRVTEALPDNRDVIKPQRIKRYTLLDGFNSATLSHFHSDMFFFLYLYIHLYKHAFNYKTALPGVGNGRLFARFEETLCPACICCQSPHHYQEDGLH